MSRNSNEPRMPLLTMSLITGFVAGIFASLMGYFAHFFNFTKINPNIILSPWVEGWKTKWFEVISISFVYGLISIVVALIYYFILRKKNSALWGIGYGVVLFAIVFFVIQPLITEMQPLLKYDKNTILTGLCSFIIYGVFIGYSISYEYQEIIYFKNINPNQSNQ